MNDSGILPQRYNVLVLPVEVEAKTQGGIYLPPSKVEKDEFGRKEGILVAMSPMAFTWPDWPEDAADKLPKVGDRVIFGKYQADEITGRDGQKYWLMKDENIAGVMTDG